MVIEACIVNIEAVALERIRQEYGNLRVAIVDTDCHHGDVQKIYIGMIRIPYLFPSIKMVEHYILELDL